MVERQTVVSLDDGLLRVCEGLDRRLELFGRVSFGASGACGFDGTLRLIHLFVWRLGTGDGNEEHRRDDGQPQARHRLQYRPTDFRDFVKDLPPEDRPREKMERVGAAGLGDNELLAIIIGSGRRRISALALANGVLESAGGIHGLSQLGRDDLRCLTGIGPVRAAQILAAVELGRRTLTRRAAARMAFRKPGDLAEYLMPLYGGRPVEQFGVVLLDTKLRLLRTCLVSVGTLNSSPAHPREVFREATAARAAALVLFHNHPSGDPSPSDDDVAITRRLVAAGELMGIAVVDHIVLGDTRYCSFKETGRL